MPEIQRYRSQAEGAESKRGCLGNCSHGTSPVVFRPFTQLGQSEFQGPGYEAAPASWALQNIHVFLKAFRECLNSSLRIAMGFRKILARFCFRNMSGGE